MEYTLQKCISDSRRFLRPKHVIQVLTDNDILEWKDLIEKPIPTKGLYRNEITVLSDLKEKERRLRCVQDTAKCDLRELLGKHFSKHEATRIYNLLTANKILSVRLLMSAHEPDLRDIYGIGPVSLNTLMKIKRELWRKASGLVETHDKSGCLLLC